MIHYSGQAARARIVGIAGREEAFQAFLGSVSLADVVATAEDAFEAAGVPDDMRDEELAQAVSRTDDGTGRPPPRPGLEASSGEG